MRRDGVTLLELTVVLAICAVMACLAVPRFTRLRDASAVRSAMSDLGATFAFARQTAVARRTTVAVVLDTASGIVRVRSGGQTLVRRTLRAAYGVGLAATRDSAVYDARGLGYGVSNLSLIIRRGSFVDTLTMSRLGRVR